VAEPVPVLLAHLLVLLLNNGYFIAPLYDSLAEGFLKPEGRGAIAAFSPSGLSLEGPAHGSPGRGVEAFLRGRGRALELLDAAHDRSSLVVDGLVAGHEGHPSQLLVGLLRLVDPSLD
jgi:hypothetical protein